MTEQREILEAAPDPNSGSLRSQNPCASPASVKTTFHETHLDWLWEEGLQ